MPQVQQQGRGGELKPIAMSIAMSIAMPTSLRAGLLHETRKVKFTIGIGKQKLCSGKNPLLHLLMTKNCHLPTWMTKLIDFSFSDRFLLYCTILFKQRGWGREVSQTQERLKTRRKCNNKREDLSQRENVTYSFRSTLLEPNCGTVYLDSTATVVKLTMGKSSSPGNLIPPRCFALPSQQAPVHRDGIHATVH